MERKPTLSVGLAYKEFDWPLLPTWPVLIAKPNLICKPPSGNLFDCFQNHLRIDYLKNIIGWIMHICEQSPIKIDLVPTIICLQPVWLFPKSSEILRTDYLKSIIGWFMYESCIFVNSLPSKLILCKLLFIMLFQGPT